jgi:polyphosphate glucokinase
MKVLVVDIGGTHVKVRATGPDEPRRFSSSKDLTPNRLVAKVRELTRDWEYEAVSLGYPGRVGRRGPVEEPGNLGSGWVGFDYAAAFGCPVKVLNDAAMQALGSYDGGRMLFLGLGTGLGSTLIADKTLVSLELGQLPYREGCLSALLGRQGLERLGQVEWQCLLEQVVPALRKAFAADYVVLGGGNAEKVQPLPEGARRGGNENAFRGGFRLWETAVVPLDHVSPADVYKLVL